MGKRFYDTEMFNKSWFRKLEPKLKAFWIYALCNCDLAGIIEIDLEASVFFIGQEITHEEIEANFKNQLVKIDPKRFFIKDFVEFQNGSNLNFKSPVHQKIINILEKHRLWDRVSNRVLCTPVVLVEVVVGVKVEEEVKVGVGEVVVPTEIPKTPEPPKTEYQIFYPFDSLDFKTLWQGWKTHLAELKKPYQTFSSEQAALQFLSEYDEKTATGIIKKAIKNQWKNLREPEKNETGNANNNIPGKESVGDKRTKVIALASQSYNRLANLSNQNNPTGNSG